MNDRTLRPDEEAFFRYSKGKSLTPAEQDAFYAGWRARADLAAEREKRLASAEDIHALADKLHEAGLYKASVHARSLAMELAEIEKDQSKEQKCENTKSMAEHTKDASRWSPEQALECALDEIRSGKRQANKVLVLFLDDSDGRYDVGFTQAGLSMSQAIALMEVAKPLFLEEMGYLLGPP